MNIFVKVAMRTIQEGNDILFLGVPSPTLRLASPPRPAQLKLKHEVIKNKNNV
jgi:hypothetical protein